MRTNIQGFGLIRSHYSPFFCMHIRTSFAIYHLPIPPCLSLTCCCLVSFSKHMFYMRKWQFISRHLNNNMNKYISVRQILTFHPQERRREKYGRIIKYVIWGIAILNLYERGSNAKYGRNWGGRWNNLRIYSPHYRKESQTESDRICSIFIFYEYGIIAHTRGIL